MRIGFCGAHRTGKTTLAKRVAELLGYPTVLSGTSAIVAQYGFDMATDNRINVAGLVMQQEIIDTLADAAQAAREAAPGSFVADRTPIDAAAYLLADATADRGEQRIWEDALAQVKQAVILTEGQYDAVIFVPPAIKFEPMDGKPPENALYQAHHSAIVRGLVADLNVPTMCIERHNTTVEGRAVDVLTFLNMLANENLREVGNRRRDYVRPHNFEVMFGETKLSPAFAQAIATADIQVAG
jgi:hypothetical protein